MNIPPKSLKTRLARTGAGAPAQRMQMPPQSRAPETQHDAEPQPDTQAAAPAPEKPDRASDQIETDADNTRPGGASDQQIPARRDASEIASAKNVSTESLPVLEAFQDFLETERRHARRQITAVTVLFLMLFILIAGAGSFFAYVYVGKINTQVELLNTDIMRTKASIREETALQLSSIARRTEDLSTRIGDGDSLMKKAASEISNNVSNSLSVSLAEIEEIRNTLKDLKAENLRLRNNLSRVREKTGSSSVTTSGVDTSVISAASSKPMSRPTELSEPSVTKPHTSTSRSKSKPLEISILAPGSDRPMKWRIPIGE